MGEFYNSSDRLFFKDFWDTFTFCQFVDDEGEVEKKDYCGNFCCSGRVLTFLFFCRCFFLGDIVFYRNKKGVAVRRPTDEHHDSSKSE